MAAHCLIALSKSRSSSYNTGTHSSDHDNSNKIYLKNDMSSAYATRSSSLKVPLNKMVSCPTLNVPPSPSDRVFRQNVPWNLSSHSSLRYGSNASSPSDSPDDGGHSSPSISSLDSLPFTLCLPAKCELGVSAAGPFFTATTPSSPSSSSSSSSSFSPVTLDQPVDLTRSSSTGKFLSLSRSQCYFPRV